MYTTYLAATKLRFSCSLLKNPILRDQRWVKGKTGYFFFLFSLISGRPREVGSAGGGAWGSGERARCGRWCSQRGQGTLIGGGRWRDEASRPSPWGGAEGCPRGCGSWRAGEHGTWTRHAGPRVGLGKTALWRKPAILGRRWTHVSPIGGRKF